MANSTVIKIYFLCVCTEVERTLDDHSKKVKVIERDVEKWKVGSIVYTHCIISIYKLVV